MALLFLYISQMDQNYYSDSFYYYNDNNNKDYDNYSNCSNDINYNPFILNPFDFLNNNIYRNKDVLGKGLDEFQNNKLNWPFQNDFVNNENKMELATTKYTDKFSGNKRERCKDYASQRKIIKKVKKEKEVYIEINNGNKRMGRKKKCDLNKGAHTKNEKDNIMRKIKSHFFNFIHKLLNESLKNKKILI